MTNQLKFGKIMVIHKQARFAFMKPDQWSKARKFAVVSELKPEEDRKQLNAGVPHIPAIQDR